MAEIALPPSKNPIALSISDQILCMTMLNWCAWNLINLPKGHPAIYDKLAVTTYNQGKFYWEQLVLSTIPHKIKFKWHRSYNQDLSKEIDALHINGMSISSYIQALYNYSKNKSNNFLIKL